MQKTLSYQEEAILDMIGIGIDHPTKRRDIAEAMSMSDREVRRVITRLRKYYCICNMQDGRGYYIPAWDDKDSIERYIRQEQARAKSISRGLRGAYIALSEYYEWEGVNGVNGK